MSFYVRNSQLFLWLPFNLMQFIFHYILVQKTDQKQKEKE